MPASASAANRRQFTRFPGGGQPLRLSFASGLEVQARLFDESFGGLGIDLDQDMVIEPEMVVSAEYYGQFMPAVVRNVTRLPGGGLRLGLQWSASQVERISFRRSPTELRALRKKQRAEAVADQAAGGVVESESPAEIAAQRKSLAEEIPSGVFKLSALFAAKKWPVLANSLDQLAMQAEALRATELIAPARNLLAEILAGRPDQNLDDRFEQFVEICLGCAESLAA